MNENSGEIILYQPDNNIRLEVRMQEETVWLTQAQMGQLFDCSTDNISLHLKNLYAEGEIESKATSEEISVVRQEGKRQVIRNILHYNLDAILSVGYRVSSRNATQFRRWASSVLKDYLLRGRAINQRVERLEQRVTKAEEQIGFFVRTAPPPAEGVFYDGQVFDAYSFVSDLIRAANERVVLIDNYVDDSVLKTLSKRNNKVIATIISGRDIAFGEHIGATAPRQPYKTSCKQNLRLRTDRCAFVLFKFQLPSPVTPDPIFWFAADGLLE